MRLILTIVLASSFLYSSASQTAAIFNDQAAFNATVGSSLVVFDFDSVATEISAFSNGATFADNQLTIDSLTLTTDINLPTGTGPSGLFGTFLLKETSSSFFGVFASPGGDGAGGEPADDDDFQITLSSPVTAFGMWILDNNPESGESISIFGSSGQIASIALPGSSLGSGGNGFIGFIIEPGEEFITSVVVEESSLLNDDIAFDQISFAPVPIPAAVWLFGSGLIGLIGFARRKA